MSVVETRVEAIERTVDEIRGDVKSLLRFVDEERGARSLWHRNVRLAALVLSGATIAVNVLLRWIG